MIGPGSSSESWPVWRGPNGNGTSSEKGLLRSFPSGKPKQLWTAQIGEGWSTIAVADGRAYLSGNVAGTDTIAALNAKTGKLIWKYSYPCSPGDYGGPRATPCVVGGVLYAVSREGVVYALAADTGKLVWQRAVAAETRCPLPTWGFAGSTLVDGNRVYVNIGVTGAALDRANGKIVWASGGGPTGYATPVKTTIGGRTVLAIFSGKELVGADPQTGRKLWAFPWQTSYDVNAADPIFIGDSVFIASNYGKGGAMVSLAGGTPKQLWETRTMRNHFNTCILSGGHLFGNDENTLRCLDARSGAEKWALRGIGKGGLIMADGLLIVLSERGELILLDADPLKLTERSRSSILSGTCWSHPTLAGGCLYARSHEGTAVCVDLKRA